MWKLRRAWRPPAVDSWRLALCIVFLAALAVRLYGLDWDDGADLHPDELFIAKIVLIDRIHFDWPADLGTLLDPARSGLNPRSVDPATGKYREFAYGALPLWITDFTAWLMSRMSGTNWNGAEHAYLVGRALSAILSALTLIPIAALGVAVGGRSVGLLAALVAALAPMSIQLAHFFTTDSWLTFFVAICLWLTVRAVERGTLLAFAAAGVAMGLAMATKGSVFALGVPVAVGAIIAAARLPERPSGAKAIGAALARAMSAGLAALLAFFAFEPYAALRPDVYLQSLRTQADIVSGHFDVPFTRVYSGTTPILYQIGQFVHWGYGPLLGILAILGLPLLAHLTLRRSSSGALILTSWFATYGVVLAIAEVKFLRYLEPMTPVLAVAAALALVQGREVLRGGGRCWPARLLAPAALTIAFAWSASFLAIYAHENPRVAATKWIYGDVPPGATLTAEYWDDALPRSLTYALSPAAFGYGAVSLDLYRDLAPQDASAAIFDDLSRADYVIQSSTRVESGVDAEPWRYPVQGRFFDLLRRGSLGFDRIAAFVQTPMLGPVSIDDGRADESFINYDHPRVTIYKRSTSLSRDDYDAEMAWALQRPWDPSRHSAQQTLLLDQPVGENPSVDDERWSSALTSTTPGAAAVWLLLLVALASAGAPWVRLALRRFPDRGWGLARSVGLLVFAYPIWLAASLQLLPYRALWAAVSLLMVAVAGWWLARLFTPRPTTNPPPLLERPQVHAEVAFWVVFAIFLAFRLANPDGWHPIWGGEKPMEFAQINAIGRSAYFPPYDPWYADGYINYYYYGFYLMSILFKVTGIPSEIGFNLALPAVMGMLGSGAFSAGAALANGLTRLRSRAVAGGWIAVLAVCLLGNLSALRVLFSTSRPLTDPFILWTWNGSRTIDFAITEFPFFSGLYADLHAHVVALPITVLLIALCFAVAMDRDGWQLVGWRAGPGDCFSFLLRLVLLALALGTLSATNAWDVPVYALLMVVSVFMATSAIVGTRRRALAFIVLTAAIAFLAWSLFLPFHTHFVALFGSLALVRTPTDLVQFLSHFGGIIAVGSAGLTLLLVGRCRGCRSSVPPAWLPLALAGIGVLLFAAWPSALGRSVAALVSGAALALPPLVAAWLRLGYPGRLSASGATFLRFSVPLFGIAAALVAASGRPVLGLLLALGAAAGIGWLALIRNAERFVCLLLAAGFFTAAGAEVVVIADDLIGSDWYRMNTIFKFYNQVWILLSLAGAALVARMLHEALVGRRSRPPTPNDQLGWARLGVAVAGLAFVGQLTYPILATGPRLAQRFDDHPPIGTLDARAWMTNGSLPALGDGQDATITYAGDQDAIDWLWQHVPGTPVIAEASIGPYRCNGSRISSATGLPTIIGWERHEQQQRYPDTLPTRVADVRTLYTSADPAEKTAILRRYNVEYVVVGELERLYPIANNDCTPTGSAEGIAAFDRMIGTTLEVAFSSRGTTIYHVLPPSRS